MPNQCEDIPFLTLSFPECEEREWGESASEGREYEWGERVRIEYEWDLEELESEETF